MPLQIKGSTLAKPPDSLQAFLHDNPHFRDTAKVLCSQQVREVEEKGLIYVNQREFAAVTPNDEHIQFLGSDDATTCHIAVLRHTGSGATCLAHLDGCDTPQGIHGMVTLVKDLSQESPEGRLELHLVGGFLDERGESAKLSKELLTEFHKLEDEIHIVNLCITDLNDTVRDGVHFPVIYGFGVDVCSGEVFRAAFLDPGPALPVRSAIHFTGLHKMFNIYDNAQGMLTIGPYSWEPWQDVHMWVNLPDPFIRRHLSTSPAQEPPYFEANVKKALKVIRDHPNPETSLFPNGKPWTFKKDPQGKWIRVAEHTTV